MTPRTRKILGAIFSLGISFLAARSRTQEGAPDESMRGSAAGHTPHPNRGPEESSLRTGSGGQRISSPSPAAREARAKPGSAVDLTPASIATLSPVYAPQPDGDPDPGEVIWTWVPYVENDGRGKDRPVLIIARIDSNTVAGCALSTQPHDNYLAVGRGGWDRAGRESFVNPERVLQIPAQAVRREGHLLSRAEFDTVMRKLSDIHGFDY